MANQDRILINEDKNDSNDYTQPLVSIQKKVNIFE